MSTIKNVVEEELVGDVKRTCGISYDEFQAKMSRVESAESPEQVMDFLKELFAPAIQTMLESEMDEHMGYGKHDVVGNGSGNSRNGYSRKTLKSKLGSTEVLVPRDRNGKFAPKIIKKHQTNTNELETKIIAMYAKGMTTRDIAEHIDDIYGAEISATMISNITDKIIPEIQAWQSRALDAMYPIVFLDGIRFRVKEGGKIINKCAYSVLGLSVEGKKELLGIWISSTESATFWASVLTDIQNRGVEDILICCTDDLTGFSEAIETVFPKTIIQKCIVHMIRNTLKLVAHKDKKKLAQSLREIYTSATEEAGLTALIQAMQDWPQYAYALKKWETKWGELSPFFQFNQEIRRIMYTTNAVESLHRQMRKVTKTTSLFPHDQALTKLLYLAQESFAKKWHHPVPNWGIIISNLAIQFPDRLSI